MSQYTVTSASKFVDFTNFQDHVLSIVANHQNDHALFFEDTEPTWASALFQILDERVTCR